MCANMQKLVGLTAHLVVNTQRIFLIINEGVCKKVIRLLA
jgi:hypothetical protein